MSDIDEKLLARLQRLEREVERLRVGDKVSKALLDTYYLGLTAKAADSDKLDNIDSAGFVQTSGDQTISGVKTFNSLPLLPGDTPTSGSHAIRKGYADITYGRPVFLTTPLASTSWDGDARSTTAKTKIDLSAVFGVPAGVKAVLAVVVVRDSASAANDCYLTLSPNNTNLSDGIHFDCSGLANDKWERGTGIIPCNVDGDVYYKIGASGTDTLDAFIEIWGWWL